MVLFIERWSLLQIHGYNHFVKYPTGLYTHTLLTPSLLVIIPLGYYFIIHRAYNYV